MAVGMIRRLANENKLKTAMPRERPLVGSSCLEVSIRLDMTRKGTTGLRVDLFVPRITFTPTIHLQWLLLFS